MKRFSRYLLFSLVMLFISNTILFAQARTPITAEMYISQAEELIKEGRVSGIFTAYQRAIEINLKTGNSEGVFPVTLKAVDVAFKALEQDSVIYLVQNLLAADSLGKIQFEFEEKRSLLKFLGRAYAEKGDFSSGHKIYQILLPDSENPLQLSNVYYNAGRFMSIQFTGFDSSTVLLKKASDGWESAGRWGGVLKCQRWICRNYRYIGLLDEAEEIMNSSLEIIKEHITDPVKAARERRQVYIFLSRVLIERGEWYQAQEYLQRILQSHENYPEYLRTSQRSIVYSMLVEIATEMGEFQSGIEYGRLGRKAAEEADEGLRGYLAQIDLAIGKLYARMGEPDSANYYLNLSLSRFKEIGNNPIELTTAYHSLSEVALRQSKFSDARELLQQAGQTIDSTIVENRTEWANLKLAEARIARESGNYQLAISKIDKALEAYLQRKPAIKNIADVDVNGLVSPVLFMRCLAFRIQLLDDQYKVVRNEQVLIESLDYTRTFAALADKINRTYKREDTKLFSLKIYAPVFNNALRNSLLLAEILDKEEYTRTAFFFAERARMMLLNEKLQDLQARKFAGIPDNLMKQEKELRASVIRADYRRRLLASKSENAQEKTKRKYFEARRKYDLFLDTVERDYPRYFALKYRVTVPEVDEIQADLESRTAILKYHLTEEDGYLFIVTKSDLTYYKLGDITLLRKLAKEFNNSLRQIVWAPLEHDRLASRLADILLSPVLKDKAQLDKLVIIPDDILNYLPFEALVLNPLKKNDSRSYADLDYLMKHYEFQYHYSTTLMSRDSSPEKNKQSEISWGGFAPVFPSESESATMATESLFSLSYWGNLWQSITRDGVNLKELPFSRIEVESIGEAFNKRNLKANTYLYEAANEERFVKRSGYYSHLHLASHGFINSEYPNFSGFAFAQTPENASKGYEGMLYAGEIYNLALNADLVVLSTCESGSGVIAEGEGILSTGRGFLYAGANNLVMSLWKVADRQTSTLMLRFYEDFLDGKTYSAALRSAKLEMLKDPQNEHPFYWSPFVHFGR